MTGNAQTLRDYWSGHGHAGPSHGAERDAIAWGTPGDFDRCVAQVTEHGKMTPEQAKGYCNLRHKDALGYYPSQHAARERGKMSEIHLADQSFAAVREALKYAGSGEARVPAGSATGGQFTVGSDGPSKAPVKPNPYADGKLRPKGKRGGKGSKKNRSGPPAKGSGAKARGARRSQLLGRRHELRDQLANLYAEKKKLSTSGIRSFGTGSTVKKPPKSSTTKPASTSGSKPGSSRSVSSKKPTLASIDAQIAQLKQQIAAVNSQLANKSVTVPPGAKPTKIYVVGEGDKDHDGDGLFDADGDGDGAVAVRMKNLRNPRDLGSGRFRTFQGEIDEAKQALAEGRVSDVVELLGSARALAQSPDQRLILGQLQSAMARVSHAPDSLSKAAAPWFDRTMSEIHKVGPHGYVHGWIKVGAPGDTHHTHETGDLPDKLQTGAFNYKKNANGNYVRYHTSGGKATSAMEDGGNREFSPEEIKAMSRSSDGRGNAPTPIHPITSMKTPRKGMDPRPVRSAQGGSKPAATLDEELSRRARESGKTRAQVAAEMRQSGEFDSWGKPKPEHPGKRIADELNNYGMGDMDKQQAIASDYSQAELEAALDHLQAKGNDRTTEDEHTLGAIMDHFAGGDGYYDEEDWENEDGLRP